MKSTEKGGLSLSGIDRREFVKRAGIATVALTVPSGWVTIDALASRAPAELVQLRKLVKGRVLVPGNRGYNSARLVYNLRYDGNMPAAVVEVLSEADVQAVVRWAAENGTTIAAKSGGHSYAGYSNPAGGVVIDLSSLSSVTPNAKSPIAHIGAGAQLIDVYAGLFKAGVTIPAGSCGTVGIGGLAQGGGIGLAARKFGATCDNILEARVVTADGKIRTVNSKSSSDLYWAIRGGGGGNFGVVTEFKFKTHQVSSASYFNITYPWSKASEVIDRWQTLVANSPDDLFFMCAIGTGATSPEISTFGQYFGSPESLRTVIAPLLDLEGATLEIGSKDYLSLAKHWSGCDTISVAQCHTKGTSPQGTIARSFFIAKSDYFSKPIDQVGRSEIINAIEQRQRDSASGGSGSLLLDSYGGAINQVAPSATAFVHRNQLFSGQYLSYYKEGGESQALSWLKGFYAGMRSQASGFAYQNYIDPDLKTWKRAYYGSNYERLRKVKKSYDPDNLFHFRQSIPV